jgi:hypothetical protein
MPTYTARCKSCEHIQDYYEKISNCYNTPPCEKCSSETEKIIALATAPHAHVFEPYWDPNIGTGTPIYVESKKHKKELLRKNGLREKCDYFS